MLSEPESLWRRAKVRRHQIYAKRLRSFLAPLLTMRSREGPSRTLLPRSRTVPDRGNSRRALVATTGTSSIPDD